MTQVITEVLENIEKSCRLRNSLSASASHLSAIRLVAPCCEYGHLIQVPEGAVESVGDAIPA